MRDQPEPPEEDPGPEPEGTLHPLPPVVIAGWAAAGLVGGWGLHVLADRFGMVAPMVAWAQPLGLLLLAALLGVTAYATHRTVQVERRRLETHQAVNRFVLARACALVTAFVGAGYAGYGLSWIGDPAALAEERMWRSFVAAGACVLGLVAALVLERACRVPDEDAG
ncbi:DUF3180 domain-containing protein [Nocardioides panacisoli]|uniref:DUF3180 domain-containing protein n=1 Tax=Nocardioides panacisoli TaxID=627624 RepID=UPI001C636284|nr:DUF3180 domain-containing protein [Nocardioides panacisoli]QYJ03726.1 DUF3180 domain-containing protein [Nocardioides panacisoli]